MKKKLSQLPWLDIGIIVLLLGTILGVVIPRFLHLKSDAHLANQEGVAQALSANIMLISSQAKKKGYDVPMPITLPDHATVFLIFNQEGHPQGIGTSETNYSLFSDDVSGEEACAIFLKILLKDPRIQVVTKTDFSQDSIGDYVAYGFRSQSYRECRYLDRINGEHDQRYVFHYSPKNGRVHLKIEENPI